MPPYGSGNSDSRMAAAFACAAAAESSSTGEAMAARLKERYGREVLPQLMKEMGYLNRFQVPRLDKIVINIGLGEAIQNAKALDAAVEELGRLSGQKPVVTK